MDSRLRVARGIAKNETQASIEVFQTLKRRGHPGVKLRVIFGSQQDVITWQGKSTAYIERNHLTSRLFNARQVRKTLAFSKKVDDYRASAAWQDCCYNLVRPHKSLRLPIREALPRKWLPRTPAMAAGLTHRIWTVKELLTTLPLPQVSNT
jgi:hypothetical protein